MLVFLDKRDENDKVEIKKLIFLLGDKLCVIGMLLND